MKAIAFDHFGDPEVLHEIDVETPRPGPGQVRIRVKAAGVNPIDGKIRSGAMNAVYSTSFPAIPGWDVAGVVDAVGEGVDGLKVGDSVLGWADTGAYAEYALATKVAIKPEALSFEHAATLPVVGDTVERVLRLLGVAKGETLLVNGATGGVGSLAVQLAVAQGLTVIGTAGADSQDYLASLGATPTVYGEGLVDRVRALAPQGIDAVFDAAGMGALPDAITLRGSTERIATISDPAARQLGVTFAAGNPDGRSPQALASLADQAARGSLRVTVTATYPLAEAALAHRLIDTGHVRGKLVLTVG